MIRVNTTNNSRRDLLTTTVAACAGVGMLASSYPFLASLKPSARAQASGAPVSVKIEKILTGQQKTVKWRGLPVWVLKRSTYMIKTLEQDSQRQSLLDPDSQVQEQQPPYIKSPFRSIKPNYLVVVGICTHLGCVPSFRPEPASTELGADWPGGYFCPCHGSRFDLAGRVYKGLPAPSNLVIPPHRYRDDKTIEIGVDNEQA